MEHYSMHETGQRDRTPLIPLAPKTLKPLNLLSYRPELQTYTPSDFSTDRRIIDNNYLGVLIKKLKFLGITRLEGLEIDTNNNNLYRRVNGHLYYLGVEMPNYYEHEHLQKNLKVPGFNHRVIADHDNGCLYVMSQVRGKVHCQFLGMSVSKRSALMFPEYAPKLEKK